MASLRRRFAGVAAALAAAALLAGCVPGVAPPGSAPQAPNVTVTVTQTNDAPAAVGDTATVTTPKAGEAAATVTTPEAGEAAATVNAPEAGEAAATGPREGQAAADQAGASSVAQGGLPLPIPGIPGSLDPGRAEAIDRVVRELLALSGTDAAQVCAVIAPCAECGS